MGTSSSSALNNYAPVEVKYSGRGDVYISQNQLHLLKKLEGYLLVLRYGYHKSTDVQLFMTVYKVNTKNKLVEVPQRGHVYYADYITFLDIPNKGLDMS